RPPPPHDRDLRRTRRRARLAARAERRRSPLLRARVGRPAAEPDGRGAHGAVRRAARRRGDRAGLRASCRARAVARAAGAAAQVVGAADLRPRPRPRGGRGPARFRLLLARGPGWRRHRDERRARAGRRRPARGREDGALRRAGALAGALRGLAGPSRGKRSTNVAPPPSRLSAVIAPPCASANSRAMARPRPEPCSLVVKKGVKIAARSAAGMPGPRSVTAISAAPSARPQRTTTSPLGGEASIALWRTPSIASYRGQHRSKDD